MIKKTAGSTLAILLLLTACGESAEPIQGADAAVGQPTPKPLSQTDPEAYQMDPSTAMREAPEGMRQDVQRAIVCVVDRSRRDTGTAKIDADTIRVVTEHISKGGSAQDYCNQ